MGLPSEFCLEVRIPIDSRGLSVNMAVNGPRGLGLILYVTYKVMMMTHAMERRTRVIRVDVRIPIDNCSPPSELRHVGIGILCLFVLVVQMGNKARRLLIRQRVIWRNIVQLVANYRLSKGHRGRYDEQFSIMSHECRKSYFVTSNHGRE
jgi:hypothetical protein